MSVHLEHSQAVVTILRRAVHQAAHVKLRPLAILGFCYAGMLSSCGVLVGQSASFAPTQINFSPVLSSQGLRVITSSDPSFSSELSGLLDNSIIQEIAPLLPQAIIIENSSNLYIWGFTVTYVYPNHIMPNGSAWEHRINVSPGGAVDRSHLLAPGSRYLVTPVSAIVASRRLDGTNSLAPSPRLDIRIAVQEFQDLNTKLGSNVTISVDSVVFEDGHIAGPDRADRKQKLNDNIRADDDLLLNLDGLMGHQLQAQISMLVQTPPTDEYSRHLASMAAALQAAFDSGGTDGVQVILGKMKANHRFTNNNHVKGIDG